MLDWLLEQGTKYAPLVKTGVAALSTYASYKDQQKKNEMQQAAYDDYMRDAAAAGHEAAAAIDLNLTPMEVSGVPTTKADVTDFTAVAAKGGLMSIPNRQRKRYYAGTDEDDVMEIEEEVITPEGFKMETGVDVTGEQVFYNTGQGDRANAMMIWDQMESGDKMLFDFDFEIFFLDGGWRDMIKGEAPSVEGNTMMASHAGNDAFLENRYQELLEMNLSPAEAAAQAEKELSSGNVPGPMATGGIAGLRHGGRPGYQRGLGPVLFGGDDEQMPMNPQRGQEDIAVAESEGIYDEGKGGNWFEEMFLERTGGGGKDYMISDEAKERDFNEIMTIGPRDDLKAKKIEAERMDFTGKFNDKLKKLLDEGMDDGEGSPKMKRFKKIQKLHTKLARDLMNGTNESGLNPKGYTDMTPWDTASNVIMKRFDMKKGGIAGLRHGGRPGYKLGTPDTDVEIMDEEFVGDNELKMEEGVQIGPMAGGGARGWKAQMIAEDLAEEKYGKEFYDLTQDQQFEIYNIALEMVDTGGNAYGGLPKRARKENGGIMDLGGLEKDYRFSGGFVPLGEYEKKDDVPARLSKNEFVFTADAVRAAGGGSINKGAKRMYETMKNLEARPEAQRMTA